MHYSSHLLGKHSTVFFYVQYLYNENYYHIAQTYKKMYSISLKWTGIDSISEMEDNADLYFQCRYSKATVTKSRYKTRDGYSLQKPSLKVKEVLPTVSQITQTSQKLLYVMLQILQRNYLRNRRKIQHENFQLNTVTARTYPSYLQCIWYTNIRTVIPNTNLRNTKTTVFAVLVHVTQHIVSENNSTRHEEILEDIFL